MYYFLAKYIEYKNNKEENLFDLLNNNFRFNIQGLIIENGTFLYTLSMIKRDFPINEQTFFMTHSFLHHKIVHDIYNYKGKDQWTTFEKNNNNKNNDKKNEYQNLPQFDIDFYQGGVQDLKQVLENTKQAGIEINESFQQFSDNMRDLSLSLNNQEQ